MQSYLTLLADALFFWLKVFIPLLFALRLFKKRFIYFNMDVLVLAVNNVLLIAAMLYLLVVVLSLSQLLMASYAGAEQERYRWLTRITGPYWFGWWLPVIVKVIIPQALWFEKLRAAVKVTYVWCAGALALAFLKYAPIILVSLHRDCLPSSWAIFVPSFIGSLSSLLLFLAILAGLYIVVLKRRQTGQV
jgi:hypothetical protein